MDKKKNAAEYGSVVIAPIPLKVLKFCGFWSPLNLLSSWKNMAYNLYTYFMLFILITIALLVLLGVNQMSFLDEHFAETVFLMFALFNANFKAINVLLSRSRFLKLLELLQEDRWSKPRNSQEMEIQQKYNQTTRFISCFRSFFF